ncbi:MAG: Uma2 family endonuclease [Acidobacteriia bacterium]|nr:Uma2 family endonuclease [Terriglobia bacterium]
MATSALLSVEEYLHSSYSPDREYRDGVLIDRNMGDLNHSRLQTKLARYSGNRGRQWKIEAFVELRIRVREDWYPIPDVCLYDLPAPQEKVPSRMPLLWIEILSDDDRMIDVWDKARQVVEYGSPYVWIINPNTLESELRTTSGKSLVSNQTLTIPDSPIVIPLPEVLEE